MGKFEIHLYFIRLPRVIHFLTVTLKLKLEDSCYSMEFSKFEMKSYLRSGKPRLFYAQMTKTEKTFIRFHVKAGYFLEGLACRLVSVNPFFALMMAKNLDFLEKFIKFKLHPQNWFFAVSFQR